ncbi:hypothetical protein GOV05_00430 [Candidatus Woesearchaeota archaeon]|nr:hypothetical protein [Candidatus Woesearchaeota archaeon]
MVLKRTYNIPLRREFQKVPMYKRSKRAVGEVIIFLKKHMKSDIVKVGKNLNEHIWKRGIKNPPHQVEVIAIKDDEGVVKAELVGFEDLLTEKPKDEKTDDKKKEASKPVDKAPVKAKSDEKESSKKEEPTPKPKKVEKKD